MKILVINSGSSSIKFQLIEMPSKIVIASGLVERIGLYNAELHYKTETNAIDTLTEIQNHSVGLEKIVDLLLDRKVGVIQSTDDIAIIGHRVVHGGSTFTDTTVIDKKVKDKIKSLFSLAPLHNPSNYEGIVVAENMFPKATQVAVFDTAFHQTIPEKAYKYAIPNELLNDHKVRLYGFHGTSHKYVSEKAIEYLQLQTSKIIVIHLGNGCSMTAVHNGKSIDHSLGFSPTNGLIMGTRSGDIDHGLIFHMVDNLGYTLKDVNTVLQKKSGMLGLTGHSDLRDIEAKAAKGDKNCTLALEMNAYRIKKYIGSYTAAMNGLDAIVFTAGIGENSATMRQLVCKDMSYFNLILDEELNAIRSPEIRTISTTDSKTKILVIPTNEELEIAKQCYTLSGN
ncbi:acetate/propionate family kinase [Formosa sp. A9]|uniref:acetate/propionate family kinase n=1 Tax=Formosa sp. A9 TaxID=3442641 RepID=UPI003EBAE1E8